MAEQIQYRNPVKSAGWATAYHAMTLDDRISDGAYRLFMVYEMHAQQKDSCFPGRKRLAAMLKCSEPTISRYNTELENAGYITRQRRIGTSSMTYIEDYEQIPYLKEIACRITNNTIAVSNMIQVSDQNCNVKNEQEKEKQEELGANAPSVPPASSDAPYAEISITDGDLIADCPGCGENIVLKNLSKNKAECPDCGIGLYVYNMDGERIFQPPQSKRKDARPKRVLGDLMPCPDEWKNIPYYARDKQVFELLYKTARDDLVGAIGWAVGLYTEGKMQYNKIVSSALKATQKRLEITKAAQGKTPEGHIKVDMYG